MKNAERKQVMVTMYDSEGQEIMVRLTRLIGGVWFISQRKWDELIKDYNRVSFQDPRMDAVTRLPEYVQRVIVLHRDKAGHVIYTDPEIIRSEKLITNIMKMTEGRKKLFTWTNTPWGESMSQSIENQMAAQGKAYIPVKYLGKKEKSD